MRTLEELGERKVIEIILKCLEQMPDMTIPFGDDVSAVDIEKGGLAVIKTDMLVGKTDIPPGMKIQQAARKAVVMNISDLAAKGAEPKGVLASIGIPRHFTEKDVEDIGKGLNEGCREYDTYILGGDTNEVSDLVIGCAVFGICPKHQFMKRSGASPGDVVCVTGHFGKTAAGLKILLQKLSAPTQIRKTLTKAVFMPHARLREGLILARTGAVTASIDSSDGLALSLREISKASNVGFVLDNLPIANEARRFAAIHNLDPQELCLYGGEEYELLVTIKAELWEKTRKAMERVGTVLTKIGITTNEKALLLRSGSQEITIQARGWEHFKMGLSKA